MLEIVLHEPEIPFNTGNIGRLCLANEMRLHLIEPLGFEISDKFLKRAGLDYWDNVDVHTHSSWEALQEFLGADRNYYYLTTKASKNYWDIEFKPDDILVFGAESKGLPQELITQDTAITVPMFNYPHVRSLNLSTTVGIVAYEALRQLKK